MLLIAKLNTYGVDKASQDLLLSYLTKRKRIKINMSHSEFEKSTSCVSQGSIFNISILFNIYICNLFLLTEDLDITSYAEDNQSLV